MPAGRPSKYDPEYHPAKYIELSKKGKTKAMICSEMEIARDTLYEWAKTHPEFSDAYKKGNQHRQAMFEMKMESAMCSGRGSASLFIWQSKNLFRDDYSDTKIMEHKGEGQRLVIDMGEDDGKDKE